MKPAVVFADPEALVVEYLTNAWAARSEPFKPSKVSTDFPSSPLKDNDTRIQVDLELGNADDYPITERAQVRVVCHAPRGKRTDVKALASITQALMYTHPGDEDVAGVLIPTGRSDVTVDPATQNLMVWFLARVVLKATPLNP